MKIMGNNIVSTSIPTSFGVFKLWVWDKERGQEPLALSTPELNPTKEVIVRIHSECLTGDVFSSLTCDCGPQKKVALQEIKKHGNGIFIYHRQEGRNMGLFKKIQAYNLMQGGLDTHEANILLSGSPDAREYSDILKILNILLHGYKSALVLLSNNPYKKLFLERQGYCVVMRPLCVGKTIYNTNYFQTKEQKFSHYTVAYQPYAGITLFREDLKNQGTNIARLINSFDLKNCGRKIFLGISIFPQNNDLKDNRLAKEINQFAQKFKNNPGVCIVLHLDYNERRLFYHDLKNFLALLKFRYSLQLRLNQNSKLSKIDLEILESLCGENVIFQIKKNQYALLENPKFIECFQKAHTFLLLDESFGTGTSESLALTREKIMTVIKKDISHIAVAGGYNHDKLNEITALEDYFKIPISVDAESKLHKNHTLDLTETSAYLAFFFRSKNKNIQPE